MRGYVRDEGGDHRGPGEPLWRCRFLLSETGGHGRVLSRGPL